mmetsp:Transcript_7658/g.14898  ORF Transcript_7658/g.14898 Transcript_7658/m.14898 type:complete len:204 (-) Transcript_7658:473-1084(-)
MIQKVNRKCLSHQAQIFSKLSNLSTTLFTSIYTSSQFLVAFCVRLFPSIEGGSDDDLNESKQSPCHCSPGSSGKYARFRTYTRRFGWEMDCVVDLRLFLLPLAMVLFLRMDKDRRTHDEGIIACIHHLLIFRSAQTHNKAYRLYRVVFEIIPVSNFFHNFLCNFNRQNLVLHGQCLKAKTSILSGASRNAFCIHAFFNGGNHV